MLDNVLDSFCIILNVLKMALCAKIILSHYVSMLKQNKNLVARLFVMMLFVICFVIILCQAVSKLE